MTKQNKTHLLTKSLPFWRKILTSLCGTKSWTKISVQEHWYYEPIFDKSYLKLE